MNEILYIYTHVLLEFLAELYVFTFLITRKLSFKSFYLVKFIIGVLAVAAFAFVAAILYYYIGGNVWGRILLYLILFACVNVHIYFIMNMSLKKVIFSCSLAYAAQNLFYKIFLIIWCFIEQYRLTVNWGDLYELYYRLLYYFIFAAIATGVYFILLRPTIKRIGESDLNYKMLIAALVVLGITVIVCSVEDLFFYVLSSEKENVFDYYPYYVLRQTSNIFSAVSCLIVMLLMSKTLVERQLEHEIKYLQYLIRQGERQYEISKDTIDMINVKCHDIKYKISDLLKGSNSISNELINDLQKSIAIYDSKIETGNTILNLLFTEKSLYCEQNKITFSCMADGSKLGFMSDGDLYCLFANLTDNALEAVSKLNDEDKRVINIIVKSQGTLVIVQAENYFSEELNRKTDDELSTTKADAVEHGYGMKSMQLIVRKYGGEMTWKADGDIFKVTMIFSVD